MESKYKELFQKILPKITFNYPTPDGIDYEIIYDIFLESDKTLSMIIGYNRITPQNKVTVAPKVLNDVLLSEIKNIARYINLENKYVMIQNINNDSI